MNSHRILMVSFASLMFTLLLLLILTAGRDVVEAQGPTPSADDSPLATTVPLSSNADGQAGPSVGQHRPAAPDDPDFPRSPNSPALSFSYYKVIGTAFQPRMSASTFAYTNNGCMYQNGGSDLRFQAPLIVPENSEIKYVRIYFHDSAATDMTVWLTRYEPGQANLDLTSVQSTGNTGYGTVLSSLMTQTVEMATYAYVLTWGTSVASSANQICGVRVAYYAPSVFGTFMPSIFKNP